MAWMSTRAVVWSRWAVTWGATAGGPLAFLGGGGGHVHAVLPQRELHHQQHQNQQQWGGDDQLGSHCPRLPTVRGVLGPRPVAPGALGSRGGWGVHGRRACYLVLMPWAAALTFTAI